jgi:photosystem II stability/assembly factor-like uncharacterized protein
LRFTERAPREISCGACCISGAIFALYSSIVTIFPKAPAFLALSLAFCVLAPGAAAQAARWQPIGPTGGDVISLAISPQRSVYLGTPDGHIFRSSDAGAHWALRGQVSSRHDAVIQKLLVDRNDEQKLFAAVWFQDAAAAGALYTSTDAGATWTVAGLSGEILRTVEQSPSAPRIFLAGTRSGVFRSDDAGQTWQRISPAGDPELRNVDSLAIDPRDPQTIYAGTYHLPWKTTDGGKTWNAVASGMIDDSDVMSLRVDAASSSRIFASACSGIYRSENAGALWTKLQGIPFSSRRTQAIVQDPQDPQILYAATTEGLWVTRDGGESWMRTTPREWVINDVVVVPDVVVARKLSVTAAGPTESASEEAPPAGATSRPPVTNSASALLLGTEEGGVLRSNDGGLTFAPANDGFSHRIAAGLVSDPRDARHLLSWIPGSPDPIVESRDAGAHWQPVPGTTPTDAAEIARIFSSDSGWWFANSAGLLFSYESRAEKWTPFRFAHALPRRTPRRPAGARRRPNSHTRDATPSVQPPAAASQIYDLLAVGARVYVATAQALWSGTLGDKILRPQELSATPQQSAAPGVSAADSFAPDGFGETTARFWMPAGGKILFSEDEGKTWREDTEPIAANVSAGDVRWLREISESARANVPSAAASRTANVPLSPNPQTATVLLAGTIRGLYRRSAASAGWQPVQNGLPASEPVSYFFADHLWLIALRPVGLYASRDASQSWTRLDTGPMAAQFTGVAVTADGAIVAAYLTEGLFLLSLKPMQ